VITFDNRGVGATGSTLPSTIDAMGADAIAFIRALGFAQVDLVGFSARLLDVFCRVHTASEFTPQSCGRRSSVWHWISWLTYGTSSYSTTPAGKSLFF
jgi:hypothetical protein